MDSINCSTLSPSPLSTISSRYWDERRSLLLDNAVVAASYAVNPEVLQYSAPLVMGSMHPQALVMRIRSGQTIPQFALLSPQGAGGFFLQVRGVLWRADLVASLEWAGPRFAVAARALGDRPRPESAFGRAESNAAPRLAHRLGSP